MTLSALLLTLAAFASDPAVPAKDVKACVADCLAYADAPGPELKACVSKCQSY